MLRPIKFIIYKLMAISIQIHLILTKFQPLLQWTNFNPFCICLKPTAFILTKRQPHLLTQCQSLLYSLNCNPFYINQIPNLFKLIKYKLLYTGTITANGNPLLTQWQPLIHTMPTPSYVQNMVTYIFLPSFILYLSPLLTSHRTSPP